MNETNRLLIVLLAATWIVAMVTIIFLTWAAPDRTIARLEDLVQFFHDNNTTAGKLIITLSAAAVSVLALLVIIIEFSPEDEPRELRVEQAGATTIIPADALRMRLEEALLTLPDVTAARSHVVTRDKGIAASLELTVTPTANVGDVTQEAVRVVVDTVHIDLGLAVSGVPKVKIAFGGSRSTPEGAPSPSSAPSPYAATMPAGSADASPGPLVYDESPPDQHGQS